MYSWDMQNAVVPLFPVVYVQATQPVSSTKVPASSMTANTILMAYEFTGGLYIGLWDMSL